MNKKNSDKRSPTPPADRTGFLVYRAGLAVSRGYERALAPTRLSPPEAGVLSLLAYVGPHHVRGVGRVLGLGRQSVVNVTKKLEAAKLITRGVSPENGRQTLLSITINGRETLEDVERIATQFDIQIRNVIGSENEPGFADLLKRILQAPFLAHGE